MAELRVSPVRGAGLEADVSGRADGDVTGHARQVIGHVVRAFGFISAVAKLDEGTLLNPLGGVETGAGTGAGPGPREGGAGKANDAGVVVDVTDFHAGAEESAGAVVGTVIREVGDGRAIRERDE